MLWRWLRLLLLLLLLRAWRGIQNLLLHLRETALHLLMEWHEVLGRQRFVHFKTTFQDGQLKRKTTNVEK